MRRLVLSFAIVAMAALPSMAAPGDQWILGIHHIDHVRPSVHDIYGCRIFRAAILRVIRSTSVILRYCEYGADGINRVWWELSGNAIVGGQPVGNPVPTTTELYKVELYGTPDGGHNSDYQPIEVAFHGIVARVYPTDPDIPWVGAFGTNHQ